MPCVERADERGRDVEPESCDEQVDADAFEKARAPSGIGPPSAGLIERSNRDRHAGDDDAAHGAEADRNAGDRDRDEADEIAGRDAEAESDDVGGVRRPHGVAQRGGQPAYRRARPDHAQHVVPLERRARQTAAARAAAKERPEPDAVQAGSRADRRTTCPTNWRSLRTISAWSMSKWRAASLSTSGPSWRTSSTSFVIAPAIVSRSPFCERGLSGSGSAASLRVSAGSASEAVELDRRPTKAPASSWKTRQLPGMPRSNARSCPGSAWPLAPYVCSLSFAARPGRCRTAPAGCGRAAR